MKLSVWYNNLPCGVFLHFHHTLYTYLTENPSSECPSQLPLPSCEIRECIRLSAATEQLKCFMRNGKKDYKIKCSTTHHRDTRAPVQPGIPLALIPVQNVRWPFLCMCMCPKAPSAYAACQRGTLRMLSTCNSIQKIVASHAPYVNFKSAHSNYFTMIVHTQPLTDMQLSRENERERLLSLLPDCRVGVKESESEDYSS